MRRKGSSPFLSTIPSGEPEVAYRWHTKPPLAGGLPQSRQLAQTQHPDGACYGVAQMNPLFRFLKLAVRTAGVVVYLLTGIGAIIASRCSSDLGCYGACLAFATASVIALVGAADWFACAWRRRL